jgi:transcriptional regulator with XRE-family HTH domain
MTQEQLAERAGLSVDLVKKLEQGRRDSARLTTLTALARALDVSRSELLDKRPRLDRGDSPLVLGLRDALLNVDVLAGIDPRDDAGEPTPLADLRSQVDRAWVDYWNGQFVNLAQALPGLIAEARVTERALGADAASPLARAYHVAACLLVQLGREDLAALAAERGLVAANTASDELQWAALNGSYCWALIAQGRNSDAGQFAEKIAARIEPRFSVASQEHLTVWGALVLWALAAAVEAGRTDATDTYISLASAGAARMEHDRHDYGMNFGPTQVAMQTTYAHAMLGQPDRALQAANGVRREDLYTISYGRHLLDVAQAHSDTRRFDRAIGTLKEAKDSAPVWFRHQALARNLVVNLAERQTRLSPTLRDLVTSLDAR